MSEGRAGDGFTAVESVGANRRQVHLVGFMGVGKSTVAARLARLLVWNYLDLDALIVRHEGMSIPAIFDLTGEDGFRKAESFVLRQAIQKPHTVMALGGGTTLNPENRRLSASVAVSVWLDCPLEVVRRRLGPDATDARPLWRDPAELAALYAERRPIYACADLRVDASGSPELVAQRVAAALGVDLPHTGRDDSQPQGSPLGS